MRSLYIAISAAALITAAAAAGPAHAWDGEGSLVIDHRCTELSGIPPDWIEAAAAATKMYYGHLSHGEQITGGLERIESGDPLYAFTFEDRKLPAAYGEFSIHDNRSVTPELYWRGEYGIPTTRDAISAYPETNVSMFMWCDHLTYYTEQEVSEYLSAMEALEAEFPEVTFIYATGHAQSAGSLGYNRYLRNEQIRDYCEANGKVLFDFADMDVWYLDPGTGEWESNSYEYDGHTVPIEHPAYYGDEWGHTTFENCELKGAAMWWLVSMLAGWPGQSPSTGLEEVPAAGMLEQNFPNPFNPVTRIAFSLESAGHARVDVFDAAGRLIRVLVDGELPAARHEVVWNGRDGDGRPAASGVYFYSITHGISRETRKMILLK